MSELLDTFLDRRPRIPSGINSPGRSRFFHLFGGISAECCRRQEPEKNDDEKNAGDSQRSPNIEIRAPTICSLHASEDDRNFLNSRSGYVEDYVRHIHFAGATFLVSRKLASIFCRKHTAIPACYCETCFPDKINFLQLRIPYQLQISARPGCGVGIRSACHYIHGTPARPGTCAIGINPNGNVVLTCR
jgi:hypothetical protein